jgi:hypothetical protein
MDRVFIPKSSIPPGKSGEWSVEQFTVEPRDAALENLRMTIGGYGHRRVPPGTYTRLTRGPWNCVMSDTPAEIMDHVEPVRRATGSVLITGLGLGIVVRAVLLKPGVTDVTVIERSPDVMALVAPHVSDPRLTIIQADAFEWKPPKGKRWDVVWHDIWDDICSDNLEGMGRLHRKFARRCGWQGSWARAECLRARRRGR